MEFLFWNKYKNLILSSLISFLIGVGLTVLCFCLFGGKEVKTEVPEESSELVEEASAAFPDAGAEGPSSGDSPVVFSSDEPQTEQSSELGIALAQYDVRHSKVRRNQFFANVLSDYGISQNEIYEMTHKCKGIFDTRKFKVGNAYDAYISKETGKMDYFSYEQDSQSYVLFTFKDSLAVRVVQKKFDKKLRYSQIEIKNSLWMDVQASGVSPLLAIKMADIYAWTIDFFGLQPGDSFKTLYEEISYKGEVMDIGKVYYAEFKHLDEVSYSYYFEEDDEASNVYWNEEGESLRKAFLKAPLNFTRISSGFSYHRRHPITRKVQPHTGVDYAAPMGTPVMSIGDGVVIDAGYRGPNGNLVKIKHNSVYKSSYIHLSRFGKGIRKGARVKQGQVIGYVGSTGRSTGPHLDFRIWKNGTPINPLKMKSPPARPIKPENRARFEKTKKETLEMIDTLMAQEFWDAVIGQY